MAIPTDPEAWATFAGVLGIIIFLAAGAAALRGLGFLGGSGRSGKQPEAAGEPSPEAKALMAATDALLKAVEALTARSESHGALFARLDEQASHLTQVGSEVAHVKGELTSLNRTMTIIQEHLLNQK